MSMEREVGKLQGEVQYLRQDQQVFQTTICHKIDSQNEKMDAVLLVAKDVKRNRDSVRHIWRTLWTLMTGFTLMLGAVLTRRLW